MMVLTELVLFALASAPLEMSQLSKAEVAEKLSARRSALMPLQFSGYLIDGFLPPERLASVKAIAVEIANDPAGRSLSIERLEQLSALLDSRVVLGVDSWITAASVRTNWTRIEHLDTSRADLQAVDPQVRPLKVFRVRRELTTAESRTRVDDGRVMQKWLSPVGVPDELIGVDLTLVDWSPLGTQSPPQDQQITVSSVSDGTVTLSYSGGVSEIAKSTTTTYRFDPSHNWRPIELKHNPNSVGLASVDFYYSAEDPAGLPVVSLWSTSQEDDRVRLQIWWVISVVASDDDESVPLPIPARRLEVTHYSETSVAAMVEAPWLSALEPGMRVRAAVTGILNAWGTADWQFDFDGNGLVDANDLIRAIDDLQ